MYTGNDAIFNINKLVKSDADWIFICDFDEYLYIKQYQSIKEFIGTVPRDVEQIYFSWAMVENFSHMSGNADLFELIETSKLYSNTWQKTFVCGKIFKSRNFSHNCHSCQTPKTINYANGNYIPQYVRMFDHISPIDYTDNDYPYLIHFHTRSLQNLFTKGIVTFFVAKHIDTTKLKQYLSERDMDGISNTFFKLRLPFGHATTKPIPTKPTIKMNPILIDYDRENEMLASICGKHDIDYVALTDIMKRLDEKHSGHFKECVQ